MPIRNRPNPYGPLPGIARFNVRPGVVVLGDTAEGLRNEIDSRRCSHTFHYVTIALLAFSLAVCVSSRPNPV